MYNCGVSRFSASTFTVIISLAIAILFSLSYSPSINSQQFKLSSASSPQNDARPVANTSFVNKCANYHANSPSDAGINVGGHPSGLSVDPTRSMIYTIDSASKKISVIEGITDTVSKSFSIAGVKPVDISMDSELTVATPSYIAVDPWANLLNVAIPNSNLLYIFDAECGNTLDNVTLYTYRYGNRSDIPFDVGGKGLSTNNVGQVNIDPKGISNHNSLTHVITQDIRLEEYTSMSTLHAITTTGEDLINRPVNDMFTGIDVVDDYSAYITGLNTLYEYGSNGIGMERNYILQQPDNSIRAVAVNPRTETAYLIHEYDNIT